MQILHEIGKYFLMLRRMVARPEKLSMYWKETIRQMNDIGVGSLTIIAMISVFIGAVTAIQFAYQLGNSFIPEYYTGYIVRDMMLIELAPTFSSLVLAGKVGSNIASELGSMRSTEQIDALEIMGVNTISYLVAPKILAAVFIVPFLVIISAALGIIGGMVATTNLGIPFEVYYKGLIFWFEPFNVTLMLIKGIVFPFIFSSVACFYGYYVKGGALEIGAASTKAVVNSSIIILIADFLIAKLLLS